MKFKKLFYGLVAVFVVVGVIIGTIVLINKHKSNKGNNDHSTREKEVIDVCQNSDDPKLCYDVLGPVNATGPNSYISAAVESTMDSVIKAINMTDRLTAENGNSTPGIKMALDDCKELLQFSIKELLQASSAAKEALTDLSTADIKNWLSAVIAFQLSCMDGFNTQEEKSVQSQLQIGGLDDVGRLTGLALDVASELSKNVPAVSSLNLNLKGRRALLEVDHEAYPTWFSSDDRKLLSELQQGDVVPNAVVAKDGSGQHSTVLDAINSYPSNNQGRYVIYVKAGVYDEWVTVDNEKKNILLYGDGSDKTIITGRKNYYEGVKTLRTATFATAADDFIAKSIGFENTAGSEGYQAVALRVQGDRSAFFDCAMHGYQDTLYAHSHRQFYRNCEISGTVDFIFGYSTTLIQNSKIFLRMPIQKQKNTVVADGTTQKNMATGIVIQNCEIMPDATLYPDRLTVLSYLGRPWKAFSRAVFLENVIGDLIQPEGYIPWSPMEENTQNCYFAEFGNTGPGADTSKRVKWAKGLISKEEATRFTAERWLLSNTWLPATGIPFDAGFTKS